MPQLRRSRDRPGFPLDRNWADFGLGPVIQTAEMKPFAARFLRGAAAADSRAVSARSALSLWLLTDLAWLLFGRTPPKRADTRPSAHAARSSSPTGTAETCWNASCLRGSQPSRHHPGSEIIVVDNGSDRRQRGLVRAPTIPQVRVLALPENLGFGGGSNAGFRAAKNDIVVLLNSDMRVEPDFLAPLLAGFTDDKVFAVSCQIFLSDPTKRREETGLTQGWWQDGGLRVSHREDPAVDASFPAFTAAAAPAPSTAANSSSSAASINFSRPSISKTPTSASWPGNAAGKCSISPPAWSVTSIAAPSARRFSTAIHSVAFCRRISCSSAGRTSTAGAASRPLLLLLRRSAVVDRLVRRFSGAHQSPAASCGPSCNCPAPCGRAGERARSPSSTMPKPSARSQPAYFHDRFSQLERRPDAPRVLFVSPYPICPPTHGGGLFMYYTLRELSRSCEVHAIVMLDYASRARGQ